jgi:hypothetical protein
VSFRLQPAGIIAHRPGASIAVLTAIGLLLLLLGAINEIGNLPVNRYR